MDTCRHALLGLTLTLSLAIGGAAPAFSGGGDAAGASPEVTIYGASPAQQERVASALASFEREGLALPDVAMTFVGGADACNGKDGWFEPGEPLALTICSELAYVVTHELAHAWIDENLTEDDQSRYLEARGLLAWNDKGLDWHERGIEDAAFVMQQNLMITRIVADDDLWRGRAEAYELLTGNPSPLQFEPSDSGTEPVS